MDEEESKLSRIKKTRPVREVTTIAGSILLGQFKFLLIPLFHFSIASLCLFIITQYTRLNSLFAECEKGCFFSTSKIAAKTCCTFGISIWLLLIALGVVAAVVSFVSCCIVRKDRFQNSGLLGVFWILSVIASGFYFKMDFLFVLFAVLSVFLGNFYGYKLSFCRPKFIKN